MEQELTLSKLIANTEARIADYKNRLELIHRDKVTYPPSSEFTILQKELNRNLKTFEERQLKILIKERIHENQGLNPPYFYPEYHKQKDNNPEDNLNSLLEACDIMIKLCDISIKLNQ